MGKHGNETEAPFTPSCPRSAAVMAFAPPCKGLHALCAPRCTTTLLGVGFFAVEERRSIASGEAATDGHLDLPRG